MNFLFKQSTRAAFVLTLTLFVKSVVADSAGNEPTLTPKDVSEQPASPSSGDSAELAKKLSNPVANLISVPFQFNYDGGFGPKDANKLTLNIQPVIPVTLNDDWNLIIRTIVPVIYQDSPANGIDSKFGLGDTTQSFFFSPTARTSGGWMWGAGPVFLWPTATADILGSGKWGAGPTGLILRQDSGWTYGVLANHIWSYAGDSDRSEVNATFIQPFLSYTWPTATTVGINTESTYDWHASRWTVPLNLTVSQLLKFGKQPVQFSIGPRYYAERPDGGPEWGVRFTATLMFPNNQQSARSLEPGIITDISTSSTATIAANTAVTGSTEVYTANVEANANWTAAEIAQH